MLLLRQLFLLSLIGAALPVAAVRAESAPEKIGNSPPGAKNRFAQRIKAPIELAPADLKLQPGERLIYDIKVNGMPAGKSLLEIRRKEVYGGENGPEVCVVAMETRSNRAISLFYNVKALAKSFVDVKGGFSRFFYIDRREGDVKAEERIAFKYDIGNMEATYERPRYQDGDKDAKWRVHMIPLFGKTLDPLSAIYYLRSLQLEKIPAGKETDESAFVLPICTDRRVWNMRVMIKERGIADFGKLKNRAYIKIVPEAEFKGLFERKGNMTIWLDEETKIPLKLACEIPIGPAEILLDEFTDSPLNK